MIEATPFGSTGMTVTRTGFGAWAIGGGDWAFGWGPQDDEDSIATIRHAVELGINWVDTAAVYGLGHSERIVARALADLPSEDRPYVFTKCGLVWDPSGRQEPPRRVGAAASLRTECEESLRRLGAERIDLYQLHWPPEDGTPIEESWQTLLALKQEGKIAAAGLSNVDVPQLASCEALGHVDSVQPPFSAISRGAAAGIIPWCAEQGTAVIVYSPMASGLLSGSWSQWRSETLDPGDWRRRNPQFHGEQLRRNLALAEAFAAVASRHEVSTTAVAVAWTLTFPGVAGAIVGARRPSQVDGWAPAGSLVLTSQDLVDLAAAIEETGAGEGPVRPVAVPASG